MMQFPQGLGLATLFGGLLVLMVFHRGTFAQGKINRVVVFALLLVALFHTVLLSTTSSDIQNIGLFRFDGVNACFAILILVFLLLSHFNLYFDKMLYEHELGSVQIATAFLALVMVFANHFIVLIIALPAFLILVFFSPQLTFKSRASLSLFTGIPWALLFLVILVLSAGLMFQEYHSLRFDEIQTQLMKVGLKSPGTLAWGAPLILFTSLMFVSSFSFFLKDFEEADSWPLIGYFRMLLPLVGAMLCSKWILELGGEWKSGIFVQAEGFPVLTAPVIFFVFQSFLILVQSLFVRRISQLVQVYATQPLLLTLWGISHGNGDSLYKGVAGLVIYAIAIPLTLKIFIVLDIKPFEKIEGCRLALRRASFPEKFQISALLLILSPLGTFIGFSLIMTTMKADVSQGSARLLPAICAASLFMAYIILMGELFDDYSSKKGRTSSASFLDHLFGYGLLIFLLVLGIYPTPLYNYVSYILNKATLGH